VVDAIYLGLDEMRKASTNRKARLIISDGGENHRRYTERDIKQAAKESDVEMYAVGIFEPLGYRARTRRKPAARACWLSLRRFRAPEC